MADSRTTREKVEAGLAARHFKERAFQITGMIATTVGVLFLGVFFADLFGKGSSAFVQTFINLDVEFDAAVIAPGGEPDFAYADFDGLARAALRKEFPDVSGRSQRRELHQLLSIGAGYQIRDLVQEDPSLIGTTQSIWLTKRSSSRGRRSPRRRPAPR